MMERRSCPFTSSVIRLFLFFEHAEGGKQRRAQPFFSCSRWESHDHGNVVFLDRAPVHNFHTTIHQQVDGLGTVPCDNHQRVFVVIYTIAAH